jgi:hypothetical protein
MSDDVYCESCKKHGRRRRMYPAPEDWFFLEAKDDDSGEIVIVHACSVACAASLWKKGPGPRFTCAEVMGLDQQTTSPDSTKGAR